MEVIRGWHNVMPEHYGCVATIGNFDGVHLGHRALIEQPRGAWPRTRGSFDSRHVRAATAGVLPQGRARPRVSAGCGTSSARSLRFRSIVSRCSASMLRSARCLRSNSWSRSLLPVSAYGLWSPERTSGSDTGAKATSSSCPRSGNGTDSTSSGGSRSAQGEGGSAARGYATPLRTMNSRSPENF